MMLRSKFHGTITVLLLLLVSFHSTCQAKGSKEDSRGNPNNKKPYASTTYTNTSATATYSIQSCSGCGDGSCVYKSYGSYDSDIDNKARQGIFYLKSQKGLTCSFVNTYFSGYVCPCDSVCREYTTYSGFLSGYCKKFVSGGSSFTNACKDYVWKCCAYPYYC
jgi:hypothetical protein